MSDGRKYYCLCEANCKFETMTKEQILAAIAQAAETGLVFDADAAFITKIKEINGGGLVKFWVGTQAQWNAIAEKDQNCFPIFTDDTEFPTMAQAVAAAVNHMKATDNPHKVTAAQVGAAPSGYGLGERRAKTPHNNDINNATETGIYTADGSPAASLPDGQNCDIVFVMAENVNNIIQFAFSHSTLSGGRHIAIRYGDAKGYWDLWQWIIPPMVEGIEYLTAENYNRKPVYAKRIEDVGNLPSTGQKTVAHGLPSTVKFVRVEAVAHRDGSNLAQMFPLVSNDGFLVSKIHVDSNNVNIYAFGDVSNYTASVALYYIKP